MEFFAWDYFGLLWVWKAGTALLENLASFGWVSNGACEQIDVFSFFFSDGSVFGVHTRDTVGRRGMGSTAE
jgi:hypothetical protein